MGINEVIIELDRLVSWGYSRGKIGGKILEGFQKSIKALSEMEDPANFDVTRDRELSLLVSENQQLRTFARFTGLTPKALAYLKETNDEFLEWFDAQGFTIHTDLQFEAFMSLRREIDMKCEIDLANIACYEKLLSLATVNNMDKMRPYIAFMRDLCPHLTKWFDQVYCGETIDEWKANNELYSYNLNN